MRMVEFLRALRVPENEFLRLALAAGLLASVASGVIGSYVVTRRITYIAGGVAHCILGGIGASAFIGVTYGVKWLHPLLGATAAALLAAVIIGLVSLRARQREDTVISALWAVGMAAGILFIYAAPGYAVDPMTYLFGNILMVSKSDLWLIAGLDVLVVGISFAFYKRLLAVCFDEEFARLRGVNADAYYLLLLCLTALTVVSLVTVVGIVLAIALLALPAAVAGHFSKTLWHMMVLAVLFSAVISTLGLGISYGANLPAGAAIVVLAGIAYLLTAVGARLWHWRRIRPGVRPGNR
jgi:zinc transport system permease protein